MRRHPKNGWRLSRVASRAAAAAQGRLAALVMTIQQPDRRHNFGCITALHFCKARRKSEGGRGQFCLQRTACGCGMACIRGYACLILC